MDILQVQAYIIGKKWSKKVASYFWMNKCLQTEVEQAIIPTSNLFQGTNILQTLQHQNSNILQ